MKVWQKAVLVVVASSFPLGVVGYHALDFDGGAKNKKGKPKKAMAFDEVMLTKSSELAEINLRIATVRGELLKFESNRKELLGEISVMRDRLTHMVETESKDKDPQSSVNTPNDQFQQKANKD